MAEKQFGKRVGNNYEELGGYTPNQPTPFQQGGPPQQQSNKPVLPIN
jgi:hypothetical protein